MVLLNLLYRFYPDSMGVSSESEALFQTPLNNAIASHRFDTNSDPSPNDRVYKPWDSGTWPWEFRYETSSKPYLVICHKFHDWIYSVSNHFTILRIIDGELPPWNATTMLIHEDSFCENHTYVKEAIRRRKAAAHLDINDVSFHTGWKDGVFWPDGMQSTKTLQSIKDRPALVRRRGEVFWRNKFDTCADIDFIVDRQTESPLDDCLTIHYLQGVASAYFREYSDDGQKGDLGVKETADMYTKKELHPKANPNISFQYDKFCSFLIRYDPSNLVKMFNSTNYDIDAIVRHLFFHQLSEYKPCTRITDCGGFPYNAYKCMSRYKFHITMENSLVDGYVSEKIFNGALGSGVPIYFGASDIGSFVNAKSFVHCNVSRSVIEEMRTFYPRAHKPRPFLFNRSSTGFYPTEEELFHWADGYLRPHLEPCVNRVIELDINTTAYKQVVSEPFITQYDILDGQYPSRGIEHALDVLKT